MDKNVSKFHENVSKNYDERRNKGYILEVDAEYPKHLLNLYKDLPFLAEKIKLKNIVSLFARYMIRKTVLFT